MQLTGRMGARAYYPKGSKNGVTIAIENMMEGEAEVITRRCIDLANSGDPTALKRGHWKKPVDSKG
jgi:hypothetical protein